MFTFQPAVHSVARDRDAMVHDIEQDFGGPDRVRREV
jgi:hypothetical protein